MVFFAGCKKSPPANVAATVNNRVITHADLDKQYTIQFQSEPGANASEDLVVSQKLEVLRTLIDNEIMLQRAEKLGLMAVDADVESKFNELKALSTQEEFQKQLAARKMTVEELKAQLRRDLSIQKLFNKEITSHISISDKDVADFYNVQPGRFQPGGAADSHGADAGYAPAGPRRPESEGRQGAERRTGQEEDHDAGGASQEE